MTIEPKLKLKDIITSSALSSEDKEILIKSTEGMDQAQVSSVLLFIEKDPSMLQGAATMLRDISGSDQSETSLQAILEKAVE